MSVNKKLKERAAQLLTDIAFGPKGVRNEAIHRVSTTASARATAPFYLRNADSVGKNPRTEGRPVIQNFGNLSIGDQFHLVNNPQPTKITIESGADLSIGNNVFINNGCVIASSLRITIGNDVRIGPRVCIVDDQFRWHSDGLTAKDDDYIRRRQEASTPPGRITIDDHVWLGVGCSIMPNVHVGRGAAIGAGSIVDGDVPPYAVVGGNPARVIKVLDAKKFERINNPNYVAEPEPPLGFTGLH